MSAHHDHPYRASERTRLLQQARQALSHAIRHGSAPPVDHQNLPPALLEERATFVTLQASGRLRGCIGRLEAERPLIDDVNENAVAAGLADPRFPPVSMDELHDITISISILTPPEPLTVKDEANLLAVLRPGVDGLILEEGMRRATFLPSVWEELPSPAEFVTHLKRKAGWAPDYWSDRIKVSRYQAVHLSEDSSPPDAVHGL